MENSSPTRPLSTMTEDEHEILSRLTIAFLPQPEPEVARSALLEARWRGVDGRKFYDMLVRARPEGWPPIPAWETIAPPEYGRRGAGSAPSIVDGASELTGVVPQGGSGGCG